MGKAYIYVEGKTDEEFLKALIDTHRITGGYQIFKLQGNHERIHEQSDRVREGKMNLFVLDSDANNYENVRLSLNQMIEEEGQLGREVNYDCHFVDENLEHLIRQNSPAEKASLWTCIDSYAECTSKLEANELREVDPKTKVYIYVNAHEVPTNFKGNAFHSNQIWDLNHASHKPLSNFLKNPLGNA